MVMVTAIACLPIAFGLCGSRDRLPATLKIQSRVLPSIGGGLA
jgi:hypothetical protein